MFGVYNFAFGQYWNVNKDETISCSEWYVETVILPELRNASIDRKFSPGIEIPGAFIVDLGTSKPAPVIVLE